MITSPTREQLDALLANLSPDPRVRGSQFEDLVDLALLSSPAHGPQVKAIWRWENWAGRDGRPDLGIDRVAETHDGDLWAIQAKCVAPEHAVSKREIDSFLSASATGEFTHRLLVMSTDQLSTNARDTLVRQTVPVQVLGRHWLGSLSIAWPTDHWEVRSALREGTPQQVVRAARRPLRPHQQVAVADCIQSLAEGPRATLVMACGTGKTLTAHGVAAELKAHTVLVAVPSLALLAQTMREWSQQSEGAFRFRAVCSDASVYGRTLSRDDEIELTAADLIAPALTDPAQLAEFLGQPGGEPTVVFSTYHSAPVVSEAQALLLQQGVDHWFDLAVADEAHYLAGRPSSAFATFLDKTKIRARRRLFTTATPRLVSPRARGVAGELSEAVSMDSKELFGARAHTLTFGAAIAQRLLSDYRVLVLGVDSQEIATAIRDRHLALMDDKITDASQVAAAVAALRAIDEYGARRIISFHSRVDRAARFAELVDTATSWAPTSVSTCSARGRVVSGSMPTHRREELLRQLEAAGSEGRSDALVLTNARCLTAGIDVPNLDAIIMADPRRSKVDIVQAVGRAIRNASGKAHGLIIVPVPLNAAAGIELGSGAFDAVWEVLGALRDHDDVLAEELDQLRRALGAGRPIPRDALSKIAIDLPSWAGADLVEAIRIRAVEVTTSSFQFGLGVLQAHVAEQGDACVPSDAVRPDGFPLGRWVIDRRREYRKGNLTSDRVCALESLPGWRWDPRDDGWREGLAALHLWAEEKGDARVAKHHVTSDGFKLGAWVFSRRQDFRKGRLAAERMAALESLPGWAWDPHEQDWVYGLAVLHRHVADHGNARPPRSYVTSSGFQLGAWTVTRRQEFRKGKLAADRVAALEALPGWTWDSAEQRWLDAMKALRLEVAKLGHARIPRSFETSGGLRLGAWVNDRRLEFRKGKLAAERVAALEMLPGWTWDPHEQDWKDGLAALRTYGAEHGHTCVPQQYVAPDGLQLGVWVNCRRRDFNRGRLSSERIAALEALPAWAWSTRARRGDA